MAQKVFEGDVVFSILIGRFFLDQSKSKTQHLLRRIFRSSQGPPCNRIDLNEFSLMRVQTIWPILNTVLLNWGAW